MDKETRLDPTAHVGDQAPLLYHWFPQTKRAPLNEPKSPEETTGSNPFTFPLAPPNEQGSSK